MDEIKAAMLSKVLEAKKDVDEAETALDGVLAELRVAPRAQKTTVTQIVQEAFDKLRVAKSALADVETILKRDP